MTILEEALDALEGEESALAAQARARLAVELAYDADSVRRERLSATALSTARACADPRTLAAALGARHVVLWGPDHTDERLPLADEMLALARRADDPALELQARTWRIVDLEELGDGAALEAELEAYAATAARVPHSALAWYVAAWQSTRAFLGRPAGEGAGAATPSGQPRTAGRRRQRPVRAAARVHPRARRRARPRHRHSVADGQDPKVARRWPTGRSARGRSRPTGRSRKLAGSCRRSGERACPAAGQGIPTGCRRRRSSARRRAC